jgi:predicted lipid carrier protein YhbT
VWTFFTLDQTAGFVQRRIAHETAVHLWDAQAAHEIAEPIGRELARDGIDEYLDAIMRVLQSDIAPKKVEVERSGERFLFQQTDGDGEWLVAFAPEKIRVSREPAEADVSIGGTASDIQLFLMGRVPADRLDVEGDASLCDRWSNLVGTF